MSATKKKGHPNVFRQCGIVSLMLLFLFRPSLRGESQAQAEKSSSTQQEVSVVLKLIQVYVLDKKGDPVTDLTKEDFILYDNGLQQTITDFENHLRPRAEVTEETIPTPLTSDSRLNRKFFFLLDVSQNDMRGLKASKKAALTFLNSQTLPTDQIAILTYSHSRGIKLHEYLTTRHETIRQRIATIREIPGVGLDEGYEEDTAESEDLGAGYENLLPTINQTKDRLMQKTADFAAALKDLSRALRGVDGFKNIVLFSAGIPAELLEDAEDSQVREGFEDAIAELGSSGCPLFTVDTNIVKDEVPNKRGDNSLRRMARLSGGTYFPNAERAEAVARSIDEITGHYYVLGYVIDGTWDGRFHRIQVEVKRPGCVVATPEGFYNPKPYPEWSDFEKKTHLFDLAVSETPHLASPARLPASAYSFVGPSDGYVLFVTEIREDALPGFAGPRAELTTLFLDEKNTVIRSAVGEFPLAFSAGPMIYAYSLSQLPAGSYRYRLILVDPSTGSAARGEVGFAVEDVSSGNIRLSTPFLFTIRDDATYARIESPAGAGRGGRIPKESGIKEWLPFITNRANPVIQGLERPTARLFGMIQCAGSGKTEPALEFKAALVGEETARTIPLGVIVRASERDGSREIVLLEFALPELPSAAYRFLLTVEDKANLTTAEVSLPLRVY